MKAGMVAVGLVLSAALGIPALGQTESADIATKSGVITQPASGMGQVVFFRPGSLMGAALGCTVHEGDREVARLGSGKYYVVAEAPGKHEFFTKGEATDKLDLEVEDGETYFVKCNIGMGIVSGRANLSPSDRATFVKKAKKLTMWKGKDAHRSDTNDATGDGASSTTTGG